MDPHSLELEIAELYTSDQAERTVGWENINFKQMRENDKVRLTRAKEIYEIVLRQNMTLSGESLYQLGLLYQHSPDIKDFLIAKEIGEMSGVAGYTDGDWLSAAAEDRYLIYTTGQQKWGTQFQKSNDDEWERAPMMEDASSGVTDEMRAGKSVPPRARQLDVYLARADI